MIKNSAQSEAATKTHSIATAAHSVGVSVQTVRLYELRGLITPARTSGGTRRYHAKDLNRLQRISDLIDRGVNLAGVGIILELEDENVVLRKKLAARTYQSGVE
ncbi:MerR family transcriptional regulator [Glutamicibacter sp.]|uniref:MerR family transcriptional regulator n=1 Tax=Glutamicibacter sp. TaxID=1931995 RepID=UPI002FE17644